MAGQWQARRGCRRLGLAHGAVVGAKPDGPRPVRHQPRQRRAVAALWLLRPGRQQPAGPGRRRLARGPRLDGAGQPAMEPAHPRRRQPHQRGQAGPGLELCHAQAGRQLGPLARHAPVGQRQPQPGSAHLLGNHQRQRGCQQPRQRQRRTGAPEDADRHHVGAGRPGPLGRRPPGAPVDGHGLPQRAGRRADLHHRRQRHQGRHLQLPGRHRAPGRGAGPCGQPAPAPGRAGLPHELDLQRLPL